MDEIAFSREVKPNDVYVGAIREYLERKGYPGLL
jgi:hypothetical protein